MMKIYEYAHESGLKSLKSAHEASDLRLQLQSCVLVAVAEGMAFESFTVDDLFFIIYFLFPVTVMIAKN